MKVKVLKDFMTQDFGDFTSGEVRNVPDWVGMGWSRHGLVQLAEKIPVLLQSKPELAKYEVKPEILKKEVKRGRSRKHI
jgi:hypothetical protein